VDDFDGAAEESAGRLEGCSAGGVSGVCCAALEDSVGVAVSRAGRAGSSVGDLVCGEVGCDASPDESAGGAD
jgi:hypothetical protein